MRTNPKKGIKWWNKETHPVPEVTKVILVTKIYLRLSISTALKLIDQNHLGPLTLRVFWLRTVECGYVSHSFSSSYRSATQIEIRVTHLICNYVKRFESGNFQRTNLRASGFQYGASSPRNAGTKYNSLDAVDAIRCKSEISSNIFKFSFNQERTALPTLTYPSRA